jgi:hypothetical protein
LISLGLGCGQEKQAGTIGVDMVTLAPVDIAANLWKYPLPFADDEPACGRRFPIYDGLPIMMFREADR